MSIFPAERPQVVYLRVSTDKQGARGLGIDAQRAAVSAYLARQAGPLLAEFVEVESGRRADRPELAAALTLCRQLTLHILAAAALRAAKARGVRLGRPDRATSQATAGRRAQSARFAAAMLPVVTALRDHGMTLHRIAEQMNGTVKLLPAGLRERVGTDSRAG